MKNLLVSINLRTFAPAFETSEHWRDGRVVDYSSLENYRTERYRGFESLSLRKDKALLDYFKVRYSKNDTLLCPFQGIFCFFIEYAAEGIAVVAYGKRIAILIVDNNHLIAFHLILRFLRLRH